MPVEGFIDWAPGQPPLTDVQHAGNLRAIVARLDAILALDGNDAILAAPQSADGKTLTLQTAQGRSFPVALPPGPFNPAGARTVAKAYKVDDLYTYDGGSYVVLLAHTASVSISTDIAAGRIQAVALKGKDAETQKGPHTPGLAYAVGDVVYAGVPGQDLQFYRAFADVPAGGPAPPQYPWGQITLSPYVEWPVNANGLPGAGAILGRYVVPQVTFLLAGLPKSAAYLEVAPSVAQVYSLTHNGAQVGTITFAVGSHVGVFAMANFQFLSAGAVLRIVAPATQDATASGFSATLTLNR